jgi:hypothetical protein
MDLSPRSMERLRSLKEIADAASYAEVIREALKLYEYLVLEAEKGSEFSVRTRDGATTPIKLFI